MMRLLLVLLSWVCVLSCSCGTDHHTTGASSGEGSDDSLQTLKWDILITESGMIYQKTFHLTQDSLTVRGSIMSDRNRDNLPVQRRLTGEEQKRISEFLLKTDFSDLAADNTNNNAPFDHPEFDFDLQIGEKHKVVHVYMQRIEILLQLSAEINTLLPSNFQLGYNQDYLNAYR
jgi:hypothetical protein